MSFYRVQSEPSPTPMYCLCKQRGYWRDYTLVASGQCDKNTYLVWGFSDLLITLYFLLGKYLYDMREILLKSSCEFKEDIQCQNVTHFLSIISYDYMINCPFRNFRFNA